MPNGELRFVRNAERWSAMPSPSWSRSSVMRFALGTADPARFMAFFMKKPLMPLPSSGRSGAAVSATSTSPFGSTYSQRGWSSPSANATTSVPPAATGRLPSAQPTAGAIFTVGISDFSGFGSSGSGPMPRSTSRLASLPQAVHASAARIASDVL